MLHGLRTLIVLLCLGFAQDSFSAGLLPGVRPLWTAIGASGGPTIAGGEAAAYGHLSLGLRLMPVVPELTLREGIVGAGTPTMRQVGSFAAGARFLLPALPILVPSFRVAFSHQHEQPWAEFQEAPLASVFGVHQKITHRTGFEAGGGIELCLDPKGILSLWVQGTAMVYPGSAGPPVTVLVEGGIAFSAGPR